MKTETYRVFFPGGSVVLLQAASAADAMEKLSVNGQAACGAQLEPMGGNTDWAAILAGGGGKAEWR